MSDAQATVWVYLVWAANFVADIIAGLAAWVLSFFPDHTPIAWPSAGDTGLLAQFWFFLSSIDSFIPVSDFLVALTLVIAFGLVCLGLRLFVFVTRFVLLRSIWG